MLAAAPGRIPPVTMHVAERPVWPAGVHLPDEPGWPVALRAGALVLRPLHYTESAAWDRLRRENRGWTGPWDATLPPEAPQIVHGFAHMVHSNNVKARRGELLPFAMAWDPAWPDAQTPEWRTELIGQVTVSSIVYGAARLGSVGYWVSQRYAGRGLVPLGVALVADYCWHVLMLHRLEVSIRPENAPSLRVVAKLGFREEGFKPGYLNINGRWADHRCFGLNREDVPGGMLNRYLAGRTLPGAE